MDKIKEQELTAIFMKRLRTILFSGFSDLRCPGNKELRGHLAADQTMCIICIKEAESYWQCPCTKFGEDVAKEIAIRVVERYFGQKINFNKNREGVLK